MKQLLLILVMLFSSSITYAQTDNDYVFFDFTCGPTAAEIAAEKAAARTLDLEALSSGTTSVDVSWNSGHIITVDIDVISADDYGHRNYGYHSDAQFEPLLDDVKAAVTRADDYIAYLSTEPGMEKLRRIQDIKDLGTPNIIIQHTREANNVDAFTIHGGNGVYGPQRTTYDFPLEDLDENRLPLLHTTIEFYVGLAQDDYKANFIGSDSEISATVSESVTQEEKKAIFESLVGKVTSSGKTIYDVVHGQGTKDGLKYHIVQVYTGEFGNPDPIRVDETALIDGSLENMEDSDLIEFYKRVALAAYDL